jgi:hypothetical protein
MGPAVAVALALQPIAAGLQLTIFNNTALGQPAFIGPLVVPNVTSASVLDVQPLQSALFEGTVASPTDVGADGVNFTAFTDGMIRCAGGVSVCLCLPSAACVAGAGCVRRLYK